MKSESLSLTTASPIALLPRLAVLGAVVLWGASFRACA